MRGRRRPSPPAIALAAALSSLAPAGAQSCLYTVPDLVHRPQLGNPKYLVVLVQDPPREPIAWLQEQMRLELSCQSYGKLDPVVEGLELVEPGGDYVPGVPEFRAYVLAGLAANEKDPCDYERIVVFGNAPHWKWPFQEVQPRPGGDPIGAIGRIDQKMLFTHIPPIGEPPPPHQVCGLPRWTGSPDPFHHVGTAVHEVGHTYGWSHAQLWFLCPLQEGDPTAQGHEIAYGDEFDPMGDQYHTGYNGVWAGLEPTPPHLVPCASPDPPMLSNQGRQFHHFSSWYKLRAGWLDPQSDILEINGQSPLQGPFDVCLRGIDDPLTAASGCGSYLGPFTAVRVRRDADHDYWVYWRRYENQVNPGDPGSFENRNGPVVSIGQHTNLARSILLDMHPGDLAESRPYRNAPLSEGQTFTDPGTGLKITFVARSETRALVRFENVPAAPQPLPRIGLVDATGFVGGPAGAAPDTAVYRTDWKATATDPAGAPIASVEMWLYEWSDAFALRRPTDPTSLFPRNAFTSGTPLPSVQGAAVAWSGSLTSGPTYVWPAGQSPTIEVTQGRYFLVVQATTQATAQLPARTNVVWWSHTVGVDE